ncbi:MAG: nucleoside hydrolase, partial [Ilumatobacter sp.]
MPADRARLLLDCDPGHDDAVAIIVAAAFADVVGIVTVAGNAPLDRTTHNALVMRDLIGLDAPVHAGCERPLVAPPRHAGFVHGESGLDGAELPEPITPLDGTDGVEFIIDTCRS